MNQEKSGQTENLYKDVQKNQYGYYELRNRASQEELDLLYKESYYQNEMSVYRQKYTHEELKNKYARLQRMYNIIEKRVQMEDGERRFLDIGCGEGFALKFFMDKGYDVTGIEFSVHGCKYHNPEVVEKIITGDACSVLGEFKPQSYAGVILMDNVLEHVLDPEHVISKITQVSKTGTCLIITVPNDFSKTQHRLWERGYIESPFWVTISSEHPEHLSYFNKDALENLLSSYGWKMEFVMGSYPIDFNLFNKNTDYVSHIEKGKSCYLAMLEIEGLMNEIDEELVTDLYGKLGEAGLGRNITAYFKLK